MELHFKLKTVKVISKRNYKIIPFKIEYAYFETVKVLYISHFEFYTTKVQEAFSQKYRDKLKAHVILQ